MLRSAYTPDGLSAIYTGHVNLAVWRRDVSEPVRHYAFELVQQYPGFSLRQAVPADTGRDYLLTQLPVLEGVSDHARQAFTDDLALLCEMYVCLFDIQAIGLRLNQLSRAMCPRFHVDHLVCRMVCTYWGAGTEWLPESSVNRSALGVAATSSEAGVPDTQTGDGNVQQLGPGWVALLKGEKWPGNEGRGLVHRSPAASPDQPRLVVTLDAVG